MPLLKLYYEIGCTVYNQMLIPLDIMCVKALLGIVVWLLNLHESEDRLKFDSALWSIVLFL
jgi:hypothetical protein